MHGFAARRLLLGVLLTLVVAFAGCPPPPAAAAPARPGLGLSLAVPFRGEVFSISTAFPTRVRRPVLLQRLHGARWVSVARGLTSARGAVRFSHRSYVAREVLRISAPGYRAQGHRYPARLTTARTVRTASQSVSLSLVRDSSGHADAVVTAAQARLGRLVALQSQARAGASWTTVRVLRAGRSRSTAFANVMTLAQARGRRLRGYLAGFHGAPAVASAVHLPPTVELESRADRGSTVLTAITTGAVRRVRFFLDGTLLAEDTSAPWQTSWVPRPGEHDVVARAVGPLESAVSPATLLRTPESAVGADTGIAEGFALETVQSGFELPTSVATTGSGLVLVTEKAGLVKAITHEDETGWSLPRTVLDVRPVVIDTDDAGLIGVAVDPDFTRNGFAYFSYVLDDGSPAGQREQVQQVARYTWDGTRFDPASRHVVLGSVTGAACHAAANVRTPDCVPIAGRAHTIGDLAFDADGHLLVGIGDGSLFVTGNGLAGRPQAMRAQDPEVLNGKILRIDPATGRGVPGNPLFTGNGSSNASRVLAMGFRNPFRFTVHGDHLLVGEVGESAAEELDVVHLSPTPGAPPNYGWPCLEGEAATTLPDVEQVDNPFHACVAVRAPGATELPSLVYPHSGGGSVTGGVFLDSSAYPDSVRGRYLFGDYAQNFIRTAEVSEGGEITGVTRLADSRAADGPVKFLTGPDGLAWTLSIFSGSLRRLQYTGQGPADRCATGTFRRSFHDLDGPDSTFDQEFPDDEWAWLYPYAAVQLPAEELAPPTCAPEISLPTTNGSPWATEERPDTRTHPGDRFGVAWRGRVDLDAGTYRFDVNGTEWVRLWVDDEVVHDFYSNGFWPLSSRQHEVVLPAGQHTIRAEHVHGDAENAAASVTWQRIGGPPAVRLVTPVNGAVAENGRVPWSVEVSDPDGDTQDQLREKVQLDVDFLHYADGSYHAHPDSRVQGQLSGTLDVDDAHAPGAGVIRLRARATDASGARTTSAPVYVCFPGGAVGPCQG